MISSCTHANANNAPPPALKLVLLQHLYPCQRKRLTPRHLCKERRISDELQRSNNITEAHRRRATFVTRWIIDLCRQNSRRGMLNPNFSSIYLPLTLWNTLSLSYVFDVGYDQGFPCHARKFPSHLSLVSSRRKSWSSSGSPVKSKRRPCVTFGLIHDASYPNVSDFCSPVPARIYNNMPHGGQPPSILKP